MTTELSAVAFCRAHAAGRMASRDKDRGISLPRLREASVDVLRTVLGHLDITDPLNVTTWTMLHVTSCYWRALQHTLRKEMGIGQMPLRLHEMLTAGRAYAKRMMGKTGGGGFLGFLPANLLLSIVFRDAGWFLGEMTYSVPDSIRHDMSPQYPYHPDSPCVPFSVPLELGLLDSEDTKSREVPLHRFNVLWECMHPADRKRLASSFWRCIGRFESDALVRNHNVCKLVKRAIQTIISSFGTLHDSRVALVILRLCVANTRRCWKPDCHRKYFRLRDMNEAFFRNVGCFEECRDLLKAVGWVEGSNCLRFNGTKEKSCMIKDDVSMALRSMSRILAEL